MKALGVIPARLGSTRFPGKPLAEFFGKTMIEHTYAAAVGSKLLSKVVVASDSERVLRVIQGVGGDTVSLEPATRAQIESCRRCILWTQGAERVRHVVNIQGDEPGVNPRHIDQCIKALRGAGPDSAMSTLKRLGDNWEPEFSASATGNAVLDAARGITGSGAAAKQEQGGAEWTRLELCIIASLQLVLVLVAYRMDRSQHPMLISESAVAIFLGVLVGLWRKQERRIFGLTIGVFFVDTEQFGAGVLIFYPMVGWRIHKKSVDDGLMESGCCAAGIAEQWHGSGSAFLRVNWWLTTIRVLFLSQGFFSNFNAIMLLAIVGTLIATFITGGVLLWIGDMGLITKLTAAEAYLYGALISAVDPVATLSVFKKNGVPPLLFNLVFGESMLNDGVAIVSFTLFQGLIRSGITDVTLNNAGLIIVEVFGIGFGSVGLAAVVCFTSAFLLKQADPVLQQYPSYEISIVLLSAYLSYVIADLVGMSGIVALFFSGVLMSHYHLYNIADESATALRHLLTTSSFLAENFVFVYMGMSVVAYSGYFTWDWGFILANLIACLLGRLLNTFPMCMLANLGRSDDNKIPWSHMVVIWFAGLRGAIAFALALNVYTPNRVHASVIQSTTLFTVMFTTLGAKERLLDDDDEHDADTSFRPIDRSVSRRNISGIHGVWERIDEKYLKPLFGGCPRDQQESDESSAAVKRSAMNSSTTSPRNRSRNQEHSPKEMLALYEAQRRAHETVLALQTQIEEEEAVYLEETPHGNIIRGWDGFIDSKQPRKDANPKKIKPYTETEHLFSNCCFYATMAGEPSFDQVDIYNTTKDECAGRRKLTVTLSVGKGADSISGVVDSTAALSTHAAYRGGKGSKVHSVQKTVKTGAHPATGKGAADSSSQASKLKKRKREAETAKAFVSTDLQTVAALATTATATVQPPASDFLDVL
ncbi:Nucleotide-diphospho-sugar transferase [Phytophthora cactorum]|nr:Nucleotide-diphospho-sugar transferase [Phytophthora cactorum]